MRLCMRPTNESYPKVPGAHHRISFVCKTMKSSFEVVKQPPPPQGGFNFWPAQQDSMHLDFPSEERNNRIKKLEGECGELGEDLHGMVGRFEDLILGLRVKVQSE